MKLFVESKAQTCHPNNESKPRSHNPSFKMKNVLSFKFFYKNRLTSASIYYKIPMLSARASKYAIMAELADAQD